MAVDYDLVVIGNTPEGRYAVLKALYLKARVAWVLQPTMAQLSANESVFNLGLSYVGTLSHQHQQLNQWGMLSEASPLNWVTISHWIEEIEASGSEDNIYADLAALGTDIIQENGEFVRKPYLSFVTPSRKLRSRFYLVATGSYLASSPTNDINGLEEVGYLTLSDLKRSQKLAHLPQNILILGGNSLGIDIAYPLQRLGKSITLVIETDKLLPHEDPEIVTRIQAQLEASGMILYTNSKVTQARMIEGEKWLQVGTKAITTDEIVYLGQRQPAIEGLNLAGVKVNTDRQGIQVNHKLQTTHPQIYACGSVIGGYNCVNIAQYEANIAIKNMLFFPIFKINYNTIPYQVLTYPSVARVGLSETQAKQVYGDDIIVVTEFFKYLSKAQVMGETTGLCKVITRRNGEILGVHLLGVNSAEIIGIFAIAIQQKRKIQTLTTLVFPHFTVAEIINKMSLKWQHLCQKKQIQTILETCFFWKRNHNK